MPEWIGQTIGKVRVDKYLARGGMAEVYLGTHLSLERPVAIKVMHSFIESDPELLERFQREAKAVAGLRHSNIVQVFDFDTYEGHPYIVMEYLQGPALASYLHILHENGHKLTYEQIGQLLKTIVAGMDYAHAHGVIHRDMKPANIILHTKKGNFSENSLLTRDVETVITDFGLARITHSGKQTASGLVSGTPSYMSPEQARGNKVDHRTDIYSIGIILYEMVAGRVPFDGDSAISVIFKHINDAPPPIEDISPELQSVINKALTKFPEDRYNTGHQLLQDYQRVVGIRTETADATIHSSRTQTPKSAPVSKKKSTLNPLWIGGGIFVCACLSLVLVGSLGLTIFSISPKSSPTQQAVVEPTATEIQVEAPLVTEVPVTETTPLGEDTSVGVLRFQDGTAIADQITVQANLEILLESSQYEVWLIDNSGEQSRSIGVLTGDDAGVYTLRFVDPQSRNMLSEYSRMEITVEPKPDNSPNPSGEVAYSSGIPGRALAHIRHLMVSTDETPGQIGMIDGLKNNATLIDQNAKDMLTAMEQNRPRNTRSFAEAINNLIVGNQDPSYKDWDGNGKISDPGDGYGILVNGIQTGYVGGAHHHSSYSADADDSTLEIRMHNDHVEVSIHNVESWAIELRDIAQKIAQAPNGADIEADVRTAVTLAVQILNGLDINGNELIEPIEGEGGALTAYQHAYYMADMLILPGKNQMPPTDK